MNRGRNGATGRRAETPLASVHVRRLRIQVGPDRLEKEIRVTGELEAGDSPRREPAGEVVGPERAAAAHISSPLVDLSRNASPG